MASLLYLSSFLTVLALTTGAPSGNKCCTEKTVGGVEYRFVRDGMTGAYSCLADCIYEMVDSPGSMYCFAAGDLKVECEDAPSTYEPSNSTGSGVDKDIKPECPDSMPDFDSICAPWTESYSCEYGQECCCGQCSTSIIYHCDSSFGDKWAVMNTDFCFLPDCSSAGRPTSPPGGCTCPNVWADVCGVDGNTYSNDCEAQCRDVDIECKGKCPCKNNSTSTPDCVCLEIYSPVCGVNGKTYSNDCKANCGNIDVECEGECPCKNTSTADCVCPEIYAPVCGVDGNIYSNDCEANCENIDVECHGECPCKNTSTADCVCIEIYAPVCGIDGKVYDNNCFAGCAGVEIACEGELCPCQE